MYIHIHKCRFYLFFVSCVCFFYRTYLHPSRRITEKWSRSACICRTKYRSLFSRKSHTHALTVMVTMRYSRWVNLNIQFGIFTIVVFQRIHLFRHRVASTASYRNVAFRDFRRSWGLLYLRGRTTGNKT